MQLHFALFDASTYVLKPMEMRFPLRDAANDEGDSPDRDKDAYWPPSCGALSCTTITVKSLHNLPKVFVHRICSSRCLRRLQWL